MPNLAPRPKPDSHIEEGNPNMTIEEAIAALDLIQPDADPQDQNSIPEDAHKEADRIVLDFAGPAVTAAYYRVVNRLGVWWYA